ncbi:hydantoinase/oxoprolinase family protein [Methylobacterium sp. WL64]|uniref:hydantoinase/oxoprolinase family protein n=1 Tax=Methylobacterium sp. WL64 TaxID=2603894 RepID=UPI0011CC44EC|nr:hydantoinase/oxoprolinase family protein [Methylobacterium sp. WL64]TXM98911.1 hydantoinase/oxoprolinase family protein [Methylobacterium sp. WL64]
MAVQVSQAACVIGVDVGGTFTDAVVLDAGDGSLVAAFKLPSTPDDPGRAIVEAIGRIAERFTVVGALVCHGTTIGTNTLIERRGARTALVATEGFSDVIELRRQARPHLYDSTARIVPPLVDPEDRHEVDERMGSDGEVVTPLGDLDGLTESLRRSGVEAVAVSLLNAYANEAHEVSVVEALRAALPGVYVTRATDVCSEFREYERTSTAVVNSYIGPRVARYMRSLEGALRQQGVERLMVVKSNGGLTSPENAARFPVHLIESGPAAGLCATAAFARIVGPENLIAFDMGGTTAKAGVIRKGEPETASEFYADRLSEGRDVGGYAIRSPILELVEIGAGGGSIAAIDEAGVLKVGPRSAGALPGPACYGRGGDLPTVTDAHAVIGTLVPELFEGTGVTFQRQPAEEAIRRHIAQPYGWSLARAAYAIIDLAVANMASMVRLATVQRGFDPRDFTMLASGGAGPLHAPLVAAEIRVPNLIIPPYPGMFSALGATLGAVRHEVVRTVLRTVANISGGEMEAAFAQLQERAAELLADEPKGRLPPRFERSVDARFAGQLFEIRLPIEAGPIRMEVVEASFRAQYLAEYGIELKNAQVQLVALRLVAVQDVGVTADGALRAPAAKDAGVAVGRRIPVLDRDGGTVSVPLVSAARGEAELLGPALIAHQGSTVWIHHGQRARIGANGQITIAIEASA